MVNSKMRIIYLSIRNFRILKLGNCLPDCCLNYADFSFLHFSHEGKMNDTDSFFVPQFI